MSSPALPQAEILIIGAGIIGLSLALELDARGARVTVVDRDTVLSHASAAAAGMLAAHDPYNPPDLQELAQFSVSVYTEFLQRIERLGGMPVPYQTRITNQYDARGVGTRLVESSIDPRQLAPALLAAAKALSIDIREHEQVEVLPTRAQVVWTTGAWAKHFNVSPRKGQMLRVELPRASTLTEVHRAEHVYIVPRTQGPQAGTALIGATVEDVGFDLTTHAEHLVQLRAAAADLTGDLRFLSDAPIVEAWAGLRPGTPDNLPTLARVNEHELVATGHFRNGILLAPGTAKVIADLIEGRQPRIDISPFRPTRYQQRTAQPSR